jgi:hypothetical protein
VIGIDWFGGGRLVERPWEREEVVATTGGGCDIGQREEEGTGAGRQENRRMNSPFLFIIMNIHDLYIYSPSRT